MSALAQSLPTKKFITRDDIKNMGFTDSQASNKICYLKRRGLINTIRKGLFENLLFDRFDEREKIQLAMSLFPVGYVTGYEALRYWSVMSSKYEGICLRVDRSIMVAVPQIVSRSATWGGYKITPVQIDPKLRSGVKNTRYGAVAEPEKAILDLLYLGRNPDNIEFDMLETNKLKKYAFRYPPRVANKICR